jgi:hypothetical protein
VGPDRRRLRPRYGALVLAAVSAVAINSLLKAILGPTPLETSTHGTLVSGNFPSGHVVYITSLCSLLGWFALVRGRHVTFAAMLLLILGMGPFFNRQVDVVERDVGFVFDADVDVVGHAFVELAFVGLDLQRHAHFEMRFQGRILAGE